MDSRDSVLSSFPLLDRIAGYCDAVDVMRSSCVDKSFNKAFNRDEIWENLCNAYGFRSLTPMTKTRGKRSFRSIYFSALCIECRHVSPVGNVVIDTNGGSYTRFGGVDGPTNSLISMCISCFKSVQQFSKLGERLRFALPNSKRRVPSHVWNAILQKIPFTETKTKKRSRSADRGGEEAMNSVSISNIPHTSALRRQKDRFEDPHHNDYLVRRFGKLS